MSTITCTKCGKVIEVSQLQGDYSTFVCDECAEKANVEAYKTEIVALEAKSDKTESEGRRVEFLKARLASIV